MNSMWTVAAVALIAGHADDGYILLVAVGLLASALVGYARRGSGQSLT